MESACSRNLRWRVWSRYTTVPNKTPTPAVIPIASAPQNVTRIALGMTLEPPARGQRTQKREEEQ